MASYIHKMIGPDEKLVTTSRLHWIYLLKGVVGLVFCMLLAWAINNAIGYTLVRLYPASTPESIYPLLAMSHYLYQVMFIAGLLILSFYLVKYIGTELGLTTRRLILKQGVLLTTTQEADIEEIRGERMDLGWFGRILDYAYVTFDCRFVEDIKTPAIDRPEHIIRALHKLRSQSSDSITSIAAHPDEEGEVHVHIAPKEPHEAEKPQHHTPTPAEQAASLDPKVVAEVLHQAMPQIVEEMAAQGLVVREQHGHAEPKPATKHTGADDLLHDFDEASDDRPHGKKPGSAP